MDTQYIPEKAWKVYSINGDIKVVLLLNWKVFNENFQLLNIPNTQSNKIQQKTLKTNRVIIKVGNPDD